MNIGIIGIEVYFPKQYVSQTDLELADQCVGKYTKGLGQQSLSFCTVEEDVNSLALTVVHNLVDRLQLDLKRIGFLEVGTETLLDKSKSTKTVLMDLFAQSGNYDVEGVDVKNACFGATAALFHAVDWLESSACQDRLALVVGADIAVYAKGPIRPTGGAGSVALLLGPNAPLVIDKGIRAVYTQHVYDFYKPDLACEYPLVDGAETIRCYREAALACYRLYKQKLVKGSKGDINRPIDSPSLIAASQSPFDFLCCHSPFTKLVQKTLGWFALDDVRESRDLLINSDDGAFDQLVKSLTPLLDESKICARDRDSGCLEATKHVFASKVDPGLTLARAIGNSYCASLYFCLASLFANIDTNSLDQLRDKRILLFSYGSGLVSAMFSLSVQRDADLSRLVDPNLLDRLINQRVKVSVETFGQLLDERERHYQSGKKIIEGLNIICV